VHPRFLLSEQKGRLGWVNSRGLGGRRPEDWAARQRIERMAPKVRKWGVRTQSVIPMARCLANRLAYARVARCAVALAFAAVVCPFLCAFGQTRMNGVISPEGPEWVRRQGSDHVQGVIVFVHGVLGNSWTSWLNGNFYWPEMLTRDRTFDGQDIYVYSYPSPSLSRSFSIDELADNLRLKLTANGILKYKQITFVSHSMGGLITRAFIIKYQNQVANKVRFLYFYATPTTGSPFSALAARVSRNPQFGQMFPMSDPDSYLGTLQSGWLAAHLGLRSYCAYETQPVFGQIIVERQSATNLCTERLDPIDANHIDIVKPASMQSDAYLALQSAFEETSTNPSGRSSKERKPSEQPEGSPRAADPIGALAQLGWGVTSNEGDIQFEIVNKPLPDMRASARYFESLGRHFQILFQSVPSCSGLKYFAKNSNFIKLQINGSECSDISELSDLSSLRTLLISQTPLTTGENLDLSPIAGLTNLRVLVISQVASISALRGLTNLEDLSINAARIRDFSPLTGLKKIRKAYIVNSGPADLSPLAEDAALEDLTVGANEIPSLEALSALPALARLNIFTSSPLPDTSAIGTFSHLDYLSVYAPGVIDLSFLPGLKKLAQLIVSGNPLFPPSQVLEADRIGDLPKLRSLSLSNLQLSSLDAIVKLPLEELTLGNMPIKSIDELARITTLTKVTLWAVPVVDISPLLALINLDQLTVLRSPARADVLAELESRGVKVRTK
jgi:Leucine-rich repeat (LRR) protein/pimeloyl-ACP methyl ester carboxylesterase